MKAITTKLLYLSIQLSIYNYILNNLNIDALETPAKNTAKKPFHRKRQFLSLQEGGSIE